MAAIKNLAGMDVLCGNKTGILTLNKLTVDKSLIEVYPRNVGKDALVLLVARASRVENQDPIDASVVNMLDDPKEARARIKGEALRHSSQSLHHQEQDFIEEEIPKATRILQPLTETWTIPLLRLQNLEAKQPWKKKSNENEQGKYLIRMKRVDAGTLDRRSLSTGITNGDSGRR
ncbi:hypothetical protein Nepgr_007549 [Nepenthes gracilis]|uniref:Uncharacterized protein n=1 Tax=Nepenthes gracilis TaxID=150966 RepID=A0AAD3S7G7_NEPGR|nr:hypothetical protein Nepgr_007549 [Nepenthes gracilis]